MKLGKPIKFIALKPEEVIERVKKNLVVDAHEKAKRLEELKGDDVLAELSGLFTNGIKFIEPSDLSGSVKGRQNIYNHLDMMLKNAEKNAVIVTTAEGLNRKMESLMPAIERAKKRGVIVKVAAPITNENYKIARELSKFAEVRSLSKPHGRFAVIDDKQLMFMLLDDKTVHPNYDVAVWLSSDFFAKSLTQMFDVAWGQFTPLGKTKI